MIDYERRVEEFATRATKVFQLFGFQWGGTVRHCPTFSEVVDTIHDLSVSAELNWYVCTANMERDNFFKHRLRRDGWLLLQKDTLVKCPI